MLAFAAFANAGVVAPVAYTAGYYPYAAAYVAPHTTVVQSNPPAKVIAANPVAYTAYTGAYPYAYQYAGYPYAGYPYAAYTVAK